MSATVQPIRTTEERIAFILRNWNSIDSTITTAQAKVDELRIKVGRELLDLRASVEAGEMGELATWWEWYRDNFTRSRGDAEKLMQIAADDNPQKAYEEGKAKNAKNNRAYRRRKQQVPSRSREREEKSQPALKLVEVVDPPQPPKRQFDKAKVDKVVAAFVALPWPERREFVRWLNKSYRED